MYSSLDFVTSFTSNLRAVELFPSSKIAALMYVVAGREAEMNPSAVQAASVHQLPPQNSNSVSFYFLRRKLSRILIHVI